MKKTNPQNPSPQAPHPSNLHQTTNNNKVMIKLNHPSRYCTYIHTFFSLFPSLLPSRRLFSFSLSFFPLPNLPVWEYCTFLFFFFSFFGELRSARAGPPTHSAAGTTLVLGWSGLVWALPYIHQKDTILSWVGFCSSGVARAGWSRCWPGERVCYYSCVSCHSPRLGSLLGYIFYSPGWS